MEYAIISLNNNQYLVKPGAKITALGELGKVGDEVTATALLVKDGEIKIGAPNLDLPITLKVVEITKTDKVDIFKYKSKSRYRRHTGHRQAQTVLEMAAEAVKATPKKAEKAAPAAPAAKRAKKAEK